MTTECTVVAAAPAGAGILARLSDGKERRVNHILLATGYRVQIARYRFLPAQLVRAVRCTDGYPQLRPGGESSVRGLHFLGAPAARSLDH